MEQIQKQVTKEEAKKELKAQPKRRLAAGLTDLLPAAVAFVLIAIVGSVGTLILQGFSTSSSVTANSIAYNATQYGLKGINTFRSYLPFIALVIVAAILIGIVLVSKDAAFRRMPWTAPLSLSPSDSR